MFGMGMPEILLILAVALIVFGPKKLPELAKSLGRAINEFRRATTEIKDTMEENTGIKEVKKSFNDIKVKNIIDATPASPEPSEKALNAEGADDLKAKKITSDLNSDSTDDIKDKEIKPEIKK